MSKDKTPDTSATDNKLIAMRVLTDTHKHDGKPCKKHSTISVNPHTAKFLEDNHIAERIK